MATQYIRYPNTSSSSTPSYPLLAPNGSASAPSYSFTNATNTGMYLSGSSLRFSVNGTAALSITNAQASTFLGVLGVGTTSADTCFLVQPGSITTTGTIQYGQLIQGNVLATATDTYYAYASAVATAAQSYTLSLLYAYYAGNTTKGALSTLTRMIHYGGATPTQGTNNAFISDNVAFTGNYFIHSSATDETLISGNLRINTAGKGLLIKEGTNAKMGTTTLNGITAVTVNTTAVTATSRIFLTIQASGGTVGSPYVDTRSAGTSFNIKSTNAADTSTVAWMIVEPA